jgi:hypothetical protein
LQSGRSANSPSFSLLGDAVGASTADESGIVIDSSGATVRFAQVAKLPSRPRGRLGQRPLSGVEK